MVQRGSSPLGKVLFLIPLAFAVCCMLIASLRTGLQRVALEDKPPPAAPDCVSWRGCPQAYNPDTMSTSTFYDRFDSYPNAWDASPAARFLRRQYPQGFGGYATEDPTVIVAGDPLHDWPNTDFGVGYEGTYSPFKAFNTYNY